MSTSTPLNGRHIGRAHYAVRALLERELRPVDLDFESWTALNLLGGSGPVEESELTAFLIDGLRIGHAQARQPIDALARACLIVVADPGPVRTTPAGQRVWEQVTARVRPITGYLFEGLDEDHRRLVADLLEEVTERAETALAAGAHPTPG